MVIRPKDLNFCITRKRPLRLKPIILWIGAPLFLGLLNWAQSNSANQVMVVNERVKIMALPADSGYKFSYLEKIKEGINLLSNSALLKYETKNGRSNGELIRKQIALAILDKNTGEIFEHRIWVKEAELKNYKPKNSIIVEPDQSNSRNLNISINWWNSFNTDYIFPENHNFVVIANKYLWPSSNLATLPERSDNRYTEILYVPYSSGLYVSELIEAGKKYIEDNINTAFIQLKEKRVMSRFVPGQLVTNGISQDFIKNILLIEHIDPEAFKISENGGKSLVERVLVIIGANQEMAYRYTGSPAGANGFAQFINPTYQNVILKYPEAKMITDYTLGMANHVNAIKAMVLFFDEHKKSLANSITRTDIAKPLGITEEMLAAAYNGGPTRVANSINKFGPAWISGQLNLPSSQKILRPETINYIEKLRSVKQLDIF